MKGFPDALGWYDPEAKQRLSVLVFRPDGLWIEKEPECQDPEKLILFAFASENPGDQFLRAKPKVGNKIHWPADLNESRYFRLLESKIHYRGLEGWRVVLVTGPDDETMDFVPGVGVTYFEYNHHGTVASCKVELVSVASPAK